MTAVRWLVYRDPMPFRCAGDQDELGELTAPDKRTAEQLARAEYGGRVVVRALLSVEIAKREKVGPGRLLPRAPRKRSSEQYREFARRKREDTCTKPHAASHARLATDQQAMTLDSSDA